MADHTYLTLVPKHQNAVVVAGLEVGKVVAEAGEDNYS